MNIWEHAFRIAEGSGHDPSCAYHRGSVMKDCACGPSCPACKQRTEAIKVEDPGKDVDGLVTVIAHADQDAVGKTDKAKRLIMALIDQAGFTLPEQRRFAQMLGIQPAAKGKE